MFECQECGQILESAHGLKVHHGKKHVTRDPTLVCHACDPPKHFTSKKGLREHDYKRHRDRPQVTMRRTRLPAPRTGYMTATFWTKPKDETTVGAVVMHDLPGNDSPIRSRIAYEVQIVPVRRVTIPPTLEEGDANTSLRPAPRGPKPAD